MRRDARTRFIPSIQLHTLQHGRAQHLEPRHSCDDCTSCFLVTFGAFFAHRCAHRYEISTQHQSRDIITYGHGQSSVVKPHGTVSSHGAPGQSGNGDGINTDFCCVTSVVVLNGTGGARLSVGTNGVELSLGLSRVGTVMSTSTPASVRLAGSPSDAEGTLSAA